MELGRSQAWGKQKGECGGERARDGETGVHFICPFHEVSHHLQIRLSCPVLDLTASLSHGQGLEVSVVWVPSATTPRAQHVWEVSTDL